MSSFMAFLLYIYIQSFFIPLESNTIACNSDNACQSQTYHCTEGEHCDIECKGANACDQATFHCAPGAFDCTILCSGSTNIASSAGCQSIVINATSTNGGNLIVDGSNKYNIMRDLTVYCPSNGRCIISCNDDYACYGGIILAQPNTRSLSIECGDYQQSCRSLYVRCPDRFQSVDYNCILNASTSQSSSYAVLTSLDLFSENNKVLVHCRYSSSYTQCYSSASKPVLHCGTEWTQQCDLHLATNYDGWQCVDAGNACNEYVTVNATYSPTVHPTTIAPTSVGTSKITCNSDSACRNQVHHCMAGLNCYIECKGANACDGATFHCPPGALTCTVFCSGSNNMASSGGCQSIVINANSTNGGNLIVDGSN
eukprot:237090_1